MMRVVFAALVLVSAQPDAPPSRHRTPTIAADKPHAAADKPHAAATATCEPVDSPPPAGYQIGCVVATLALLLTLAMHRRASRALKERTSFSFKRLLYQLITGLAPAIGWVNFLAVTSPPMSRTAVFAQHALVAGVMACFMELLLLLLFRTSLADEAGGISPRSAELRLPGIQNVLQHLGGSFSSLGGAETFAPSQYIDGAVGVLRAQPSIAFWTSPPVGCLFLLCPRLPCARPHQPTPRLVAVLRRAVLVYAGGALLSPLLEAWVEGTVLPGLRAHRHAAATVASGVELAVTLLALYSLFITYRLSKAPLRDYHTTLKFAAVKALVFATPLQRALLVAQVGSQAGLWWTHVLCVCETPLLLLLLARAFPAAELPAEPHADDDAKDGKSDDEATRLV